MFGKDVKLVQADDWVVLYVNGIKVGEDHSFTGDQILGLLNIQHQVFDVAGTDYDEKVAAFEGFPQYFEEIPEDIL